MSQNDNQTRSERLEAVGLVCARSGGAVPEQRAIRAAADQLGLSYVQVASWAWADPRWSQQCGADRWRRWTTNRELSTSLRGGVRRTAPRRRPHRITARRAA